MDIDFVSLLMAYFSVKFVLYALRWQISTLILAPCIAYYIARKEKRPMKWPTKVEWQAAGLSNLIGALVFFAFDLVVIFSR